MHLEKIDAATASPVVALCSPVLKRSRVGSLSKMALRAGVIVSGDAHSGRSSRMKVMAEDILSEGGQVVCFTLDGSWRGLERKLDGTSSGFDIITLDGKNIPGFGLDVESAIAIAQFVAERDTSVTIPINSLSFKDRSAFLSLFIEELGRHNRGDVTVFIQGLDALFPIRSRGPESTAVSNLRHAVVTGKDRGIAIVGSVENLRELAPGILNILPTMIVTRTSAPTNIKTLATKLGDPRISKHAFSDFGVARLGFHDHWLWAFCDQDTQDEEIARYLPLRDFNTQVETNTPPTFDPMPTGTLKDLLNRITMSKRPKTPANDPDKGFVSSIPETVHRQFSDRDFDDELRSLNKTTDQRVAMAISDGHYTFQQISAETNLSSRSVEISLNRLKSRRFVAQTYDVYRITPRGHNRLLMTHSMMMVHCFAAGSNDLRAELQNRWGSPKADRVLSYMLGRGYLKEESNGMLVAAWPNQEEF